MPHYRRRHLQAPFDKVVRFARIVGILGHRQVGKTTFLQRVTREYVTLDDEDVLRQALVSPKTFVAGLSAHRSGIDECQLVPKLFPALKVRVGTSQTPGRFILTGSVRFTSRRAIRESLTGRISNLEMYPFVCTELANCPNSAFLSNVLESRTVESVAERAIRGLSDFSSHSKLLESYLVRGGLPGLFHIRDARTRHYLMRDLLETILDRDLRLVYRTSLPYGRIFDYCRGLAANPFQIVRPGSLKKIYRIPDAAQQHLLHALEAVFLLRRIPIEGDYRGDLFWFEDQTERKYLTANSTIDDVDWLTLIYRNARTQFDYRVGERAQYFHFRTRGGAQVPLAIRSSSGVVGIIGIKSRSDIDRSLRRSADSFLKRYNYSKVLFLTREGKQFDVLTDRIAVIPAQVALF